MELSDRTSEAAAGKSAEPSRAGHHTVRGHAQTYVRCRHGQSKTVPDRYACIFEDSHPEICQAIEEKKILDDELTEQILNAAKEFKEKR
mgnify:CR=1 FL=1